MPARGKRSLNGKMLLKN